MDNNERNLAQKLGDKADELKLKAEAAAAGLTGNRAKQIEKDMQAKGKEVSNDAKEAYEKAQKDVKDKFTH